MEEQQSRAQVAEGNRPHNLGSKVGGPGGSEGAGDDLNGLGHSGEQQGDGHDGGEPAGGDAVVKHAQHGQEDQ